jgi:hypothetical protein
VTAVVQTTHRGLGDSLCGTLDLVRASDGFDPPGADDLGNGVDDYSIADRGTPAASDCSRGNLQIESRSW